MYKNNKYLHKIYTISPQIVKNGIASVYSFLVARKKYGKDFDYWSSLLKKSQYYNAEQLKSLQTELLKGFLENVLNNSVYYRNSASKAGFNPGNISDIRELKKFPVIKKSDVKEHYDEILNKKCASYKFTSSGTTGTSLNVWLDQEAYQREYAYRWHYLAIAGASRKDKFAYFLGNDLHPSYKQKPPFHLIDYYEHAIFFSLFHMSDENLKYYLYSFNHFKPSFVKGYPSGLYVFAKFIKENGLTVHKPKALFSASETLHDFQKEYLEEVFQCPVYQWYGQVETTVNIHECENRNLHVMEEYGLLELLNENGDDAQPGEVASAIATGWGNKAFPLIRYNTGDNMILSLNQTCSCGRRGRIIEKIMGRDEDFIITPEGKRIGRLDFIFKPLNTVVESQIIQESIDQILIKIVPMTGYSPEDEKLLRGMVSKYIGKSINVKIELVKSIERTANGKIRYVISKVKQP
jgi:phenylacetate-CoA ligase